MGKLISLETIELIPVIELEPWTFSVQERQSPSGSGRDMPEHWKRYWLDSLADSGVVGLIPLWPASWLVTTRQLISMSMLERVLSIIVREWGGPEVFSEPDSKPVLNGGLALCCGGEVLIAPTCCSDLGNLSEWKDAVAYRQSDWRTIWIGHPWLSVRFNVGRLVLSETHESDSPVARWTISPEELHRAVAAAAAELEDFARRLEPVLDAIGAVEIKRNARRLAGLDT